mgnify:CR=1 FL=1
MTSTPSLFTACLKLARPHQYVKNLFVLLPLFFGWKLAGPGAVSQGFLAFAAFCLASSSVYVLNDVKDIEDDRAHPVKRNRPLASGAVTVPQALVFLAALLGGACVLAASLPLSFLVILGAYLVINAAYSFKLKHVAIVDLCSIAVGFVLRVFAGGAATGVAPSHWIVIMTFLLALFLGLAKRRDDLILSGNGARLRKSLDGYNLEYVSTAMSMMAAVVIVSYILYTTSPEVIAKHGSDKLYLTAFWVIAAILRYLQITFVEEKSGSPTLVFIKDVFIKACIVLWIASFYLILYADGRLF